MHCTIFYLARITYVLQAIAWHLESFPTNTKYIQLLGNFFFRNRPNRQRLDLWEMLIV